MMIQIDDKIVSSELFECFFCCDLPVCAGACCVIGDSGAPLESGEKSKIAKNLSEIKKYMDSEGIETVEKQGVSTIDIEGEEVTPLIGEKGRCAYSYLGNGVYSCAIEKAFEAGESDFRKPISCYLYPIRLFESGENTALNYDKWSICASARESGNRFKIPVFKFLKNSIEEKFGVEFYARLETAYETPQNEK